MYAKAYTGGSRRVLVVLQGMDTSGKGGVVDHALGQLRPSGLRVSSFKKPTEEELSHDFLWRVEKALPEPGFVGVFDRSHYEDVLVARVHELADEAEIERRYGAINDFEKQLVDVGHRGDQVLPARLARGAGQAAARPARRARQAVEVPSLATSTSASGGRTTGKAYAVALERCHTDVGALVRRPERQEVVPQLGRRPAPRRGAPRHAARVARTRLRRRGAEGPADVSAAR